MPFLELLKKEAINPDGTSQKAYSVQIGLTLNIKKKKDDFFLNALKHLWIGTAVFGRLCLEEIHHF